MNTIINRKIIALLLPLFLMFLPAQKVHSQSYLKTKPDNLTWWRDAKFGLFIHWSPVSIKGTEIGWSRGGERRGTGGTGEIPVGVYDNLYKQFNPVEFNAQEWVNIAKSAGMKYIVFTSKHHDGFSMFDSKLTDYKITSPDCPFGRDVVAELAKVCHENGMKLGFYYSPVDWHHPDYRTSNNDKYVAYMHGQLRELCTQYGEIDIIWFDGLGGTSEDWKSPALFKIIRHFQPHILINNRAGLEADFDTPEQRIGAYNIKRPWESCITICRQWAWKPNDELKSLKECIQTLVTCAGGDGNLLLNVGPMPNGEIEPRQVERLKKIGAWLSKNGESIYGTRGGPVPPQSWGVTTYRKNIVYVHVLADDTDLIALPDVGAHVLKVSLLDGTKVAFNQSKTGTLVSIPRLNRDPNETVIRLELDKTPKVLE